ncbi:MAG: DJ-1/PfpI family protein [Candidatus Izemoplasmatales bacterium]
MKFACLLADGFEDVEALGTSALLRRAGFTVDFYSVYNQDKVTGSYKTTVTDLQKIQDLDTNDYDGLFIPGGRAAYILREDALVKEVVMKFYMSEKWMLALCAAPTVYGMLKIMDNRHYTSFPGTEQDMHKAVRVDKKAVRDGLFITGRSAGSIYEFVFEVIKTIQGEEALDKFKKAIVY